MKRSLFFIFFVLFTKMLFAQDNSDSSRLAYLFFIAKCKAEINTDEKNTWAVFTNTSENHKVDWYFASLTGGQANSPIVLFAKPISKVDGLPNFEIEISNITIDNLNRLPNLKVVCMLHWVQEQQSSSDNIYKFIMFGVVMDFESGDIFYYDKLMKELK